ncbi:MAG TPA: aminotransferase class I/II-fold pyridoxal phosphate-dependent enzyme [Blastocatellia bacterium]|jgi:pyridoxal phosphate-dependent aminotransferase EpsN|nr:aminotransferase class I/II-fold pyridoxal phosphate-dependent enzyme [Blastocatellia bacterium]
MSGLEEEFVGEAFSTNWISTVGPHVSAFEEEFSRHIGRPAVALASGTAAIHLGLYLLGVREGDEILSPTLTFVATVNPAAYLGARPVFLDSERESWNLDPNILEDVLRKRAEIDALPRVVVVVHLYGQCADMDAILECCNRYEVPVLEDAAEALGADYKGRLAGAMGTISAFSFNGNKIITTGGGGMLAADDPALVDKARFLSTQARDAGIAYEHSEIGYNYRLSNILAGIGRGQLQVLEERVRRRRAIAFRYDAAFSELDGITLMPQAQWGRHTNWLSCFIVDEQQFGCTRDELIQALDQAGIEARPVWKPMHLQALYRDAERYGGAVAEELFRSGICLPSSSNLTFEDQSRVIDCICSVAISSGRRVLAY